MYLLDARLQRGRRGKPELAGFVQTCPRDRQRWRDKDNRDKNFTDNKLKKRMEQLEESIGRYLAELDRADRQPTAITEGKVSRLKDKVAAVKGQMQRLKQIGQQLQEAPDGQVSLTDQDARSMATSGRGTGMVGYNVQTAVDTKHHLIVAHEVRGARELLPIPVVGMTEAGLLTACMLGGRIGVVTFGRRVLPLYHELVNAYGLAARIAGWRVLESTAAYARGAHDDLDREIVATVHALVERDLAETVVLTGAVMAGVPRRLQQHVPVPLIDCIACGVRQAELLVRLALPKPTIGSYAPPANRELVEVEPAIAQSFAAATARG